MGEWLEQDRPFAKARFGEPKAYSLHAADGTQKAKHKGVDLTDRHGKWLPQAGDLNRLRYPDDHETLRHSAGNLSPE